MKVLYYDCFSGISGDMNLGAMIDLGVEKQYLIEELNKLKINNEFELEISRDQRKGIEGTKVTVHLKHHHHHHHHHHKKDTGSHHHHHEHRNLKIISDLIQKSNLNEEVKTLSIAIFKHIAHAEAKVHGKSIDEVHFHEVGATDSIVDIVGAAICFHALHVEKVICSSIELGSGFVKCAHGTMPVPAPATAEIIRNLPSKQGTIPFEATTPTGAAILAELVDEFTDTPKFSIKKTGYGIGQKDFDVPNALRVYLAEVEERQSQVDFLTSEEVIIECNIDDMNPEHYEIVFDILLDNGAKDVFIDSIMMKKMRPAHKLSVLCENNHKEKLAEHIFLHTSTFGVRVTPVKKYMLTRKEEVIQTEFGPVRIKKGFYKSKCIKVKAEYEDCKQIAANKQIPVSMVYSKVNNIISKLIDE